MTEAGFDNVFVGIETIDEDCLNECNKIQNQNRDTIESIKKIQRHGMQVQGGFILGFDNDKASVFDNMSSFIQKSGIVTAMVGILNAPTGTDLYDRMKKEKRLLNDFSGVNTDINFKPKMGIEKLQNGYDKVVKYIYSPENYYERVRTFLENYRPKNKHKRHFIITDIGAFLKAFFKFGVASKNRMDFFKLMKKGRIAIFILSLTMAFTMSPVVSVSAADNASASDHDGYIVMFKDDASNSTIKNVVKQEGDSCESIDTLATQDQKMAVVSAKDTSNGGSATPKQIENGYEDHGCVVSVSPNYLRKSLSTSIRPLSSLSLSDTSFSELYQFDLMDVSDA